jgi:hypothetical protein
MYSSAGGNKIVKLADDVQRDAFTRANQAKAYESYQNAPKMTDGLYSSLKTMIVGAMVGSSDPNMIKVLESIDRKLSPTP